LDLNMDRSASPHGSPIPTATPQLINEVMK
jgi:hypothetical protein